MQRFLLLLFILGLYLPSVKAMIPGPNLIVSCPSCGKEKELMTLISGNTFGSTQWSDLYVNAPMLPNLSPVQKCENCKVLFFLQNKNFRYEEGNDHSLETGRLSFHEIKNALPLIKDSNLSDDEEYSVRLEILHRFNDAYREGDVSFNNSADLFRSDEDWEINRNNLKRLIALLEFNIDLYAPLIAEFYREAGMFEECLKTLEGFNSDNTDYFVEIIRQKALEGDSKVFIIEN